MTETYYFSPNKIGFFPLSLKESYYEPSKGWPDDVVELTAEQYAEFTGPAPEGMVLGSSKDGMPKWIGAPEPSAEQLIEMAESKKTSLLLKASSEIAPLQDAVDLDMATEEEILRLAEWKKYRVLLNRVDVSKAPNIEWPEITK